MHLIQPEHLQHGRRVVIVEEQFVLALCVRPGSRKHTMMAVKNLGLPGSILCPKKGVPSRLGFAQANEFSNHIMEKKNYMYLAPSRITNLRIRFNLFFSLIFSPLKEGLRF